MIIQLNAPSITKHLLYQEKQRRKHRKKVKLESTFAEILKKKS